ncbi:hypothetical protein [Methylotenera mobilis]|uniref:hypothetical protein n=1 Tax=Methylotenera mobilis TaxID=359408 RepID=UPI000319FE10|nr:hypothetical protein [Methylotenera mobilis]
MLQKFIVNLSLALLFALTQIGVATHEISHITNGTQHSQTSEKSQQKSTVAEQCAQCISYAKIASGVLATPIIIPISQPGLIATSSKPSSFQLYASSPYSARAPPQIASI